VRILALTQRVPYVPDRGDRIRSHHLLKRLALRHEIWLGCLSDEGVDEEALRSLDSFCERHQVARIGGTRRLVQSGLALLAGRALSLAWYHHPKLSRTLAAWNKEANFDAVYVFCSSMAPYWLELNSHRVLPGVVDFIDVDSLKWAQYAAASSGLKGWVFRREQRLLQKWEKTVAHRAYVNLLVNPAEVEAFGEIVPGVRTEALSNGVDREFFARPEGRVPKEPPLAVFVGMMDYRANVDAVLWFTRQVWPSIRRAEPSARFSIVGARPTVEVMELSGLEGVTVTGRVDDVRPYLWDAKVAVAPLRIAQGTQNKVLEAMAASVPVVATSLATRGIGSPRGPHVEVEDDPVSFAVAVVGLMRDRSAAAAQVAAAHAMIADHHSWESSAQHLERLLQEAAESTTR